MKKSFILKAASAVCVIALLAGALVIFGQSVRLGTSYADAAQYAVGGAELDGRVENLDIEWTDGSVTIEYRAQDGVSFSETAPKPIPEDGALRWWLDGATLRIRYAKSGFFTLKSLNKALTVTLPEDLELGELKLDATAADVNASGLRAKDVAMSLTSGNLSLAQAGEADSVSLSSTSGDLRAELEEAKTVAVSTTAGAIGLSHAGEADAVALSSTSGDIVASLRSADSVAANATAGSIAIEADSAKSADIETSSGNISVRLGAFEKLQIEATAGKVTAVLPEEPGFTAEIDTTAGDFESAIALRQEGKRYACGDGSASVRIETTAGDVHLEASDGEQADSKR